MPKTLVDQSGFLYARLKESGLKLTSSRKVVLNTFLKHHGPFGAEELHKKFLSKQCDLTTVYRILSSLEEVSLIARCDLGDGIARYELIHEDHHHHHLICTDCKKLEVIEDCKVDESFERIGKKRGFKNLSHRLEFFGICPECQK